MQPLDAERVKEWRHRRMLSQQEVADRAGTSLFTIQRIERGEGNVRPKTGRGVASALGVPIEELLPKAQASLFGELPESSVAKGKRRGTLDWALAVSDKRFEAWLETATLPEVLELMPRLNKAASTAEGEDRELVLSRAMPVVARWTQLAGPFSEPKILKRRTSRSSAGREEGRKAG